jgi:hypothetical protein
MAMQYFRFCPAVQGRHGRGGRGHGCACLSSLMTQRLASNYLNFDNSLPTETRVWAWSSASIAEPVLRGAIITTYLDAIGCTMASNPFSSTRW